MSNLGNHFTFFIIYFMKTILYNLYIINKNNDNNHIPIRDKVIGQYH